MTKLVYCGDRSCMFNNNGECKNKKVVLNEQGQCMGYNPIAIPRIDNEQPIEVEENKQIGFQA